MALATTDKGGEIVGRVTFGPATTTPAHLLSQQDLVRRVHALEIENEALKRQIKKALERVEAIARRNG